MVDYLANLRGDRTNGFLKTDWDDENFRSFADRNHRRSYLAAFP